MASDEDAFTGAADGAGVSAAELQAKVVDGSFWTVINTVLSVPVAFVANAVVARYLGVGDYGRLAFLTLVLSLAVQISNLGVSDSVVRWGSGCHATGDGAGVAHLLARSLGFHVLVQLPLLLATVAWLARDSPPLVMAALLVSVLLPVVLGSAALSLSIQSKLGAGAKLAVVTGLVAQVAIAASAVATESPVAVWATRSVAGALLLPFTFLLLDRGSRSHALRVALPRAMPEGFWRYAAYSCAAGLVATLVFSRSELLVLQALHAATAAGAFALAFGLSQQVTAPADALLGPLLPAVAGVYAAHPERSQAALLRATRFSSVVCGLITAVLIPPIYYLIPDIYGRDFGAAAAAFVPLAIVSCLQSLSHPVNTFTRARGRNDVLLRAYCVGLVVDVCLAFALIPVLGLGGALVANAVSQGVAIVLITKHELTALGVAYAVYIRSCGYWLGSIAALATTLSLCSAVLPDVSGLQAALSVVVGLLTLRLLTSAAPGSLEPADRRALLDGLPARVRRVADLCFKAVGMAAA